MAFSNTSIFLSDSRNLADTELGFSHEPVLGFSDRILYASPHDHRSNIPSPTDKKDPGQDREDNGNQEQDQDQERERELESSERLSGERERARDGGGGVDGCKTPIRSEQMIPATPRRCPAAPRKVPARRLKKKMTATGRCRRRIFVDVSREMESVFPQAFLEGLSNNIKKARYC